MWRLFFVYTYFNLPNPKKPCIFARYFMKRLARNILVATLLTLSLPMEAQLRGAGSGLYGFLSLPVSSRLCALGGDNVAIQDGEISMAMMNPALLCGSTDNVLELNYAYLMQGTMFGSALYGHNFRRSPFEKGYSESTDKPNYFAVGLHYLDYGKMQYADEYGTLTGGSFTAKDIVIQAMYARQLGEQFTVGVTLKPVYSIYESYTSFALGADIGAHFQTKDSALHVGLALRNIGWQLSGFYTEISGQHHEALPLNLEAGLSYRLKHAPIRLGMTIHNIQRWNLGYEQANLGDDTKDIKWYDMMFRHTIFSLDIVPKSDKFYLTLSYNHRRRAEMNLADQRSLAGFSLGAGVKIYKLRVGFAVSQLTKSNLSYQASLSFDINSMLK